MLAHSPKTSNLATYSTQATASSSSYSPSHLASSMHVQQGTPTRVKIQPSSMMVCPPDDSDFLDSDAEGETIEVEEGLGLAYAASASRSGSPAVPEEQILAPEVPLIYISHRLFFTYFAEQSLPSPDALNVGDGAACAVFEPPKAQRPGEEVPELPTRFHWFNVDEDLVYLSFFEDWGPLNVALFYRFCLHAHQLLNDASLADRSLVLYTSSDPARKANGSLLAAMYSMIIDRIEPADAFHPFSQLEFKPFRDAGYGRADYYLTIQDILYGVHKAIREELLDLAEFNLDEYEHYEQVQNGDWNWLTPSFLAFASPNDREYVSAIMANGGKLPDSGSRLGRKLPKVFSNTVKYFKERNVKLVVRLNNPLYDKAVFEEAGIAHLDLYFDDGSNPSDEILREFIRRADEVIKKGGAIAVHCKAGLGRTGVLIGAYLIWKYGFTASEIIGFMRIMRPGCVVGPQQHFMYQNFIRWIQWSIQDQALAAAKKAIEAERAALMAKGLAVNGTRPPKRPSTPLEELKAGANASDLPITPRAQKVPHVIPATAAPAVKPVPCVGQPRKSPSPTRKRIIQAALAGPASRLGSSVITASNSIGEVSACLGTEGLDSKPGVYVAAEDASVPDSGVKTLRNSWEALAEAAGSTPNTPRSPKAEQQRDQSNATPSKSRVLIEAQRLNNVATPERSPLTKEIGSPSLQSAEHKGVSSRPRGHERSRSEIVPGSPPLVDSATSGTQLSPGPNGTPRTGRVPSYKASAHVRAAYGLKDSKLPPSPRGSPKLGHDGDENGQRAFSAASHESAQDDAEVLGVLGINGSASTTSTGSSAPGRSRPAYGRTPSSSNSISPAKIRSATATTATQSNGAAPRERPLLASTARLAGSVASSSTTNSSTGARKTSASAARSRAPSGSAYNPSASTGSNRTTVNGPSSTAGATRPVRPLNSRGVAAVGTAPLNTSTVRKASRTGSATSGAAPPTAPTSNSVNASILAASRSAGNGATTGGMTASTSLKRPRASPDIVQAEFHAASSGPTYTSKRTTSGTSNSSKPPLSSAAAAAAAAAGGAGSAVNGRFGRNVRRRRSSLGEADIGMA